MKDEIRGHINDPKALESLYRSSKKEFKDAISELNQESDPPVVIKVWYERLFYEKETVSSSQSMPLTTVLALCMAAIILVKLPDWLIIDEEEYYARNVGFIVFPVLMAYFFIKDNFKNDVHILIAGAITLFSVVYLNWLTGTLYEDTVSLSCIHMPFLLWSLLGLAFSSNSPRSSSKRIEFLKFNGDLVIMTAIILICGVLLTGVTFLLFGFLDMHSFFEFYTKNIVFAGLASAPIVATYVVDGNSQIVSKVSPIIAKIFTPLVSFTLFCYLIAVVISNADPFQDRDFLLVFNLILIGVVAIIFFTVSESSEKEMSRFSLTNLIFLLILTVVVNGIALTAIVFRISEWGFTPNRSAVIGGNILIMIHLFKIGYNLLFRKNGGIHQIEGSIATYLPVYTVWSVVVIFVFPLIFNSF